MKAKPNWLDLNGRMLGFKKLEAPCKEKQTTAREKKVSTAEWLLFEWGHVHRLFS